MSANLSRGHHASLKMTWRNLIAFGSPHTLRVVILSSNFLIFKETCLPGKKKKEETSRKRKRSYRLLGLTVDVASKPRISLSLSLFLSENWYYYSIKSISKRSSLKLKENFLLIDFDFSLFCSVSVTRMIWSDGEEIFRKKEEKMLEDQVASLLQKYLGNYVRGLNKEALKISVWKGLLISHSFVNSKTLLWWLMKMKMEFWLF